MTRRKRIPQTTQNTAGWLITYADLCVLLLSFFVLLVSMSTIDKGLQKRALGSVESSFGTSSSAGAKVSSKTGSAVTRPDKPRLSPLEEELNFLRALCSSHGIDPAKVSVDRKNIVIRLERNQLFRKGTTEIDSVAGKFLAGLGAYLKGDARTIDLWGYTDASEGIDQAHWAERSWVVSLERALTVEATLEANGIDAARMTAQGFGHYHPVAATNLPWAAEENPRVEIVMPVKKSVPASRSVDFRGKSRPYADYKSFFSDRFPVPSRNGD